MSVIHPNLLCSKEELDAYREKLERDESARQIYTEYVKDTEDLLTEDLLTEEFANSVYSQHGRYTAVGQQLERFARILGWKYAVEGDMRCARKLKEALLHTASFAIWTGLENLDKVPAWHSGLETTRIAFAFAQGFDLLYDYLTPVERDIISRGLIDKGIRPLMEDWVLPGTRIHCLDSMGHNWWAVCVGMAGICLLPVADLIPESEEWFALVEEALRGFVEYPGAVLLNKRPNFDSEGLFYESIGYFCYGAGEALRYIYHRERYTGVPCAARHLLYFKMARAMLSFSYPTDGKLLFLNFGDSRTDEDVRHFMKNLVLCGYGTELCSACFTAGPLREDITDLLTGNLPENEGLGVLRQLPKLSVFPDTGYVISRSSWEENAVLFAMKSGFTWNHTHEDAGSFMLWAGGKQLFLDSGTCSYSHPLYHGYYMRAAAHNVVLLDGRNQDEMNIHRGIRFMGTIPYAQEAIPGVWYLCADAAGPTAQFCGRNFRNVIILDHQYVILLDDIYTYEACDAEALFHYGGAGNVAAGGIEIENCGVKAFLQPVFPACTEIVFHTGHPETKEEQNNEYVGIRTMEKTRQHLLIHVIALGSERAELLRGTDSEGVRIGNTEVFFNYRADGSRMHKNSNNELGGVETDAYLMIRRRHIGFFVSASYVRVGRKNCHESFRKENVKVILS